MTTLYRPVLIETAAQAEQLPVSTRAIRPDGQAAARLDGVDDDGQWTSKLRLYAHDEVIGWTALVPVEAEEETRISPEMFAEIDARLAYTQAAYALPLGELQVRHVKRLVTRWEDA